MTAIEVAAGQQRNDRVPDQIVSGLRIPGRGQVCTDTASQLINCYRQHRGSSVQVDADQRHESDTAEI